MKRDMELIRKILFELEASPTGNAKQLEIDGYSKEQIGFHSILMMEAGLIIGINVTSMTSSSPEALPSRMTWQGYEFLEACRDNNRWTKAKGIIEKVGGVTLEVLKGVLTDLALKQINGG